MGGAQDMIIHSNTRQRGVRTGAASAAGRSSAAPAAPSQPAANAAPRNPTAIAVGVDPPGGEPNGDVDIHGSPCGAKWSKQ